MANREDAASRLTKELADKGTLIAGGFAALVMTRYKTLSTPELFNLLHAYMAGAEHVYSSMMHFLDEGSEPTEADMRRMEAIHDELMKWRKAQGAPTP